MMELVPWSLVSKRSTAIRGLMTLQTSTRWSTVELTRNPTPSIFFLSTLAPTRSWLWSVLSIFRSAFRLLQCDDVVLMLRLPRGGVRGSCSDAIAR